MKAMILAAGRGKRLMPITANTPKPLLKVGGKRLIEYHLERIARAGIKHAVINLGHLGDMISTHLGDGSAYGLRITYCDEGKQLLDTAGGVINALPWLDQSFVVINADVFTDYEITPIALQAGRAHLVMVANPAHNPDGDFCLAGTQLTLADIHTEQKAQDVKAQPTLANTQTLTFSGIGYYTPAFFEGFAAGAIPMTDILTEKIKQRLVSGEKYDGLWIDIGTPERLAAVQQDMK